MDEIPVMRRLDVIERDLRDHVKTFTAMTEQAQSWHQRLVAVELAFRRWEIAEARAEERGIRTREQLEKMEEELEALRGVGTKLLWIVAGGVITAFLAFVLRGGLVL